MALCDDGQEKKKMEYHMVVQRTPVIRGGYAPVLATAVTSTAGVA
jgi:hypothetical protein